jgi:hypothetical protein
MDTGDAALERLGIEPQMKKNVGPFGILCVGFVITNSWVGLAATMVVGMEQGGSVTVLYGMIVTLIALGCSACTMSELASVFPTAGGPYHWTSILAPRRGHDVLVSCCWSALSARLPTTIDRTRSCCRVTAVRHAISSDGSQYAPVSPSSRASSSRPYGFPSIQSSSQTHGNSSFSTRRPIL